MGRGKKGKMKTKLAVALATLLSVASLPAVSAEAEKVGVEAQQKYMLPIGSNVNSRPMTVNIGLGNGDTGWALNDQFDYTPAMGDFEKVVQYRVSVLAEKFNPPAGSERDQYVLQITAEPGPYTVVRFKLDPSNNIPPEVLEVKLDYGLGAGWKLQGITDIKMRLFKGSDVVKYYSTKDGVGPDSPCEIGATKEVLAYGYASVRGQYGFPWLKENWWDMGEITIESFDGWATFFNANGSPRDGELIAVSEPPPAFLESLRAPEMPQAPVLVISTPRIARIARAGNTTELTVSAEASGNAHLEFATAIGGNWNAVPAYPVPLQLQTGSSTFTHTIESPTAFYRLRIAESPKGQ